MTFSVATFNINSVRIRVPLLLSWLAKNKPDVLCLQEIKCEEKDFPLMELQHVADGLDYDIFILGQKSYNGVATFVKKTHGAKLISNKLPNDPPALTHSRFLDIAVNGIRVINIYAPNGNPVFDDGGKHSEKFTYKIDWLTALHDYLANLARGETPVVIVGDYNICPEDIDCYDTKKMAGDALLHPESRAAFRRLQSIGLIDLFRAQYPDEPMCYSYWDYTGGAFQKNNGLRIDHCMATAQLADRLTAITIDQDPRHAEKPSDHTPVIAVFDL
ncbi:MAG: exodeoxyribonuclease III [Hydrotalea sp.]|nr:exodeoxyribonuclease III [Hydrotalea sp.]